MNKFKTLLATLAMALVAVPATADEGMWLLPLLEKMNIKDMQNHGCKLSAKQIYNINHSLKDAVVIFGGGCTGEVVSPDGLLLTNHHCGYGAIQKLSSVEHDYLSDGYWAMDRSQELPAEGLSVQFLISFTDVTNQLEEAGMNAADEEEREAAIKKESERLIKGAVANDYDKAVISSMYGGNAKYLIVYRTFRDIRFVGAPPSSIGKFGADTDNWMWPRHTCDFSMFRVYTAPDGTPAAYSEENIPYHTDNYLTISIKGVEDGDFSMIMGYPGSTNRFMTEAELVEKRDIDNEIAIKCRTIRQEILMNDMLADPKVKIQYASKYSGSSNGWKKYIGMNETFEKLNVQQRRAANEADFREWVAQDAARQEKYGTALDDINAAVTGRMPSKALSVWLSETLGRIEISSFAGRIYSLLEESEKKADDSIARERIFKQMENTMNAFFKDYNLETDRKVAKAMLKLYRDYISPDYLPDIYMTIDVHYDGDIDKFVDHMFATSCFRMPQTIVSRIGAAEGINSKAEKNGEAQVNPFKTDPAMLLYRSVFSQQEALKAEVRKYAEQFARGKKAYIAGDLEMRDGAAIYPDANFTMRLTYGNIKSYEPTDGMMYKHYTTLDGVMQKEDPDNWEFVVPAALKELWQKKDFGRYAMKDGRMPACFINNCDITGGNSGSPVLNARGQLTGLAFDGNWEAMSGDIIFEPEYQRCICVDIRYVLFIIEKYGHASHLIDEMKIVK